MAPNGDLQTKKMELAKTSIIAQVRVEVLEEVQAFVAQRLDHERLRFRSAEFEIEKLVTTAKEATESAREAARPEVAVASES